METSWVSELFQQLCKDNKDDVLSAITADSIQKLFNILSSSVPEKGHSGQPTSEVDISLQCMVKIVHVLHLNFDSNQGPMIDLPSVLQQYFQLLDQQSDSISHEAVIFQTHVLDAICQMLDCKDKPALQAVCLGLSCFKIILANLDPVAAAVTAGTAAEEQNGGIEVWNKLLYSTVRALQALLDSSSVAKEVFEAVSGYDLVKKCLLKCHSPSKDVLFGLLKWMIGKDFQDGNMDLEDENIMLILIDWLPFISSDLQRFLSDLLMQTVMFSSYNHMVCAKAGVAARVLNHLKQRNHLDSEARELLFIIIEVLGSVSMKPNDFQELIGLLRPHEEGSENHDFDRLLQALIKISTYNEDIPQPMWYFDLRHKTSGIAVPTVQKWGGSGFTFYAWISLKSPRSEDFPEMTKTGESADSYSNAWPYRRQLYSFLTSSGTGFEGFFTPNGHLVVAVSTKKEYLTAPLVDLVVADDRWHSLLIVHSPSRKPLLSRKDQLNVYVDGELKMVVPVKLPSMSEPFISCRIGCGGPQTISFAHDTTANPRNLLPTPISSFLKGHFRDGRVKPTASSELITKFRTHMPTGHQDDFWGTSESMQGQLGLVCVFNEGIQEQCIQVLNHVDPNCVSLFQPQGTAEEDPHCVLPELATKLVLYYNAKACNSHKCTDLTPCQSGHSTVDGRLTGEVCFNWDIKNVINSVGGMDVFLPLLEQVEYHERIENTTKREMKVDEIVVEEQREEKPVNSDLKPEAPEIKRSGSMEQWVVIEDQVVPATPDPPHKTRHLAFEAAPKSNGVTIILNLLQNILKGSTLVRDSFLRSREIATLGVVLANIDSRLLDVPVLMAVQRLIETVKLSNKALMPCIFQYVLFNFALWSRCEFAIRIGHIQYLSTIIKDDPNYFRSRFGCEFILDVVRTYYMQEERDEERKTSGVDDSGAKIIRGSLFGLINYYLKQKVEPDDVVCLVEFVATMSNEIILKETLVLMHSLCNGPTRIAFMTGISSQEHLSVFFMLLVNLTNPNLRCPVIRILFSSLTESSLPQATKQNFELCSAVFSGLASHLRQTESDGFTEITLMELGLSSAVELRDLWVFDDFRIVLPIVALVQNKEISVKLHIAQTLLKSVNESVLSAVKCAQEVAWYDPMWRLLLKTRQQTDTSTADTDLVQDLLETVVQIIFKVLWDGIDGYDEDAWMARGEVIASISTISSLEDFVVPSRELERRLLELCMGEILGDIERSGETGVKETASALQVMKLLDDFVFTSGSIAGVVENEDQSTWSTKLVETMVRLLGCLNVWDQSDGNSGWTEMAEIGDKVLLEFLLQDNPEFCAYSSSMIYTIWKNRCVDCQEKVCYLLGKVYQAFKMSRDKDGDRKFTFTLPLLRHILQICADFVPLTTYVPDFPKRGHDNPDCYEEKFLQCVDSDEFAALIKQQILPSMKKYQASLSKSAIDSGRFWMECLNGLTNSLQARTEIEEESKKKFERMIESFNEIVEKSRTDFKNRRMEEIAQTNRVLRQWDLTKRDLSSEIGIWASRNVTPVFWKLSTTENFSRMRLKLTPNYHFNPHVEASRLRDTGKVSGVGDEANVLSGSVADQVLVKHYAEDRLEETEIVEFPPNEADGPVTSSSKTEAVSISFECELVTLMETVSGSVSISSISISFDASDHENNTVGSSWDFKIALSQLREVHIRNFNHRGSALEFFLIDQTNYFINFTKETRNVVYAKIMSFKPPNLYHCDVRSPAELLQASGLVKKWVRREISNFDYLIQLNTIAGRTYNDLSQYPVFPWILKDYTSEVLDLKNPDVYRDLTKPIGALNEKRAAEVKERYDQFVDPSGSIPKFHYGVHYSTAAGVLHYMVRMEPFTSLHIKLQSGRFDVADRQFFSFISTWDSIYNHGNDVKELIPEFFYLPEFLVNLNDFDLGVLHSGQRLCDVVLPKWASSPEDFIHKHREALESDHVSENLHYWIDLIFGFRQRGPAAEEALNVFYYSTYEGAVDLDAISDPKERYYTEEMINNFGQTPSQLLTEAHPKRMNSEEARELQIRHSAIPGNLVRNMLADGGELKAHAIKIYSDDTRLVYAQTGRSQSTSMINQGMHDSLITVSAQGIMGVHQWLPYSRSRSMSFTFNVDTTVTQNYHSRCIAAPFAPDIRVGSQLFAITHCAKLIITAGHWDFSIRVFASKAKLLQRLTYHNDTVMCIGLDGDGHHFISGSRDFTCIVWLINHHSGVAHDVSGKPLQVLYGHVNHVTCVVMSWELDIAVSGDKNGRCIVHTVRKGHFVQVVDIGEPTNVATDTLRLKNIALSKFGDIFISCLQDDKNSRISKYSVNGKMLRQIPLKGEVTAMIVRDDFVIIGTSSGAVFIKGLQGLENERTLNVRVKICSINITKENTHIFIGSEDGQLLVFSVDSMD